MFFLPLLRWSKSYPGSFFLVVPQPGNYIIYIAPGLDVRSTYQVICNQLKIINQHASGMVNQLRCSKLELNKIGWKYAGWIIATFTWPHPKTDGLAWGVSLFWFCLQIQAVDLWKIHSETWFYLNLRISQTDRPLFTWWGNPSNLEQHCPPFVAAAFRSFSPPWIGGKAMSMFRVKEPHPTVAEWFSHVR